MNLVGFALSPISGRDALLAEPWLVLTLNKKLDQAILIPITPNRSGEKHPRTYYRSYKPFSYEELEKQLDLSDPRLAASRFEPRAIACGTEADINARFSPGKEGDCATVKKLKRRWALLEGLVLGPDRELLLCPEHLAGLVRKHAAAIANDPRFEEVYRSKCKTRPRASNKDEKQRRLDRLVAEIRDLLNQYWAGGSTREALTPLAEKHGGPGGRHKASSLKRGRPNLAGRNGYKEAGSLAGINVTPESVHAKIIRFCWQNFVVRGKTAGRACRQMWTDFYSTTVVNADGSTAKEWLPAHKRPTEAQFQNWGPENDPADAAWRRQLPPSAFDKLFRAIQGSATDDVYSIGQRGGMDSSPPDVHLVSAINRLDRIGGAHRILIADCFGRGYIPGFYLGFDPPSERTVKLAVYTAQMGADEWREWLELLGLEKEISANDFVPIMYSNLWGDNTDLRSDEIMQCLHSVGTNVHYIPKLRSDLNGTAESGHRGLHALADHKRPGTTFGKKTERGERPAIYRARFSMMELIRDNVRAIHTWNTMPLDIVLPSEMEGVEPTRLAITRKYIDDKGLSRGPLHPDQAIRHLLPTISGTFTENGVRLHLPADGKKKTYIGRVVYTSHHPLIAHWCSLARQGGRSAPNFFEHDFWINPMIPTRIYFLDPKTHELIRLNQRSLGMRDPDLPYETTLGDLEDLTRSDNDARPTRKEAKSRSIAEFEAAQGEDVDWVEASYAQAAETAGGEPSHAQMKANLRVNRDREKEAAAVVAGMPANPTFVASTAMPQHAHRVAQSDSEGGKPDSQRMGASNREARAPGCKGSKSGTKRREAAPSTKGGRDLFAEALRQADQQAPNGENT